VTDTAVRRGDWGPSVATSDKLTKVMERALEDAEQHLRRALDELERG
jgi:hypothetical protein